MSRIIDMSKPLEELDEDDLRYAHDRNLLSIEDTEKVGKWLRERDAARKSGDLEDVAADDSDTETVLYDPSEHSVEDVMKYLNGLDVETGEGDEEWERVMAAERTGKARKGIIGEE